MSAQKKIDEKELASLQELNTEFNKFKTQLGDLSLQKHGICLRVEELKTEFQMLSHLVLIPTIHSIMILLQLYILYHQRMDLHIEPNLQLLFLY